MKVFWEGRREEGQLLGGGGGGRGGLYFKGEYPVDAKGHLRTKKETGTSTGHKPQC